MQSENINELAAALAKAQGSIRAASMDSFNPFFKKNYASLNDIWKACRDALASNGLSVIQMPGDKENEITLTTMLCHSSGQWVSSEFSFKPAKPDLQGIGAAITYARRYALAAMVGITSDEDDDGNSQQAKNGATNKPAPKPTPKSTIPTNSAAFLSYVNERVQVPYDNAFHLLNAIKQDAPKFEWGLLAQGAQKAYDIAIAHAEAKLTPEQAATDELFDTPAPDAGYEEA